MVGCFSNKKTRSLIEYIDNGEHGNTSSLKRPDTLPAFLKEGNTFCKWLFIDDKDFAESFLTEAG